LRNVQQVLAIEFLCASQARNFRNKNSFSEAELLAEELHLTQDKHTFEAMHVLITEAGDVLWK
jgi:histidine ammonia-lyase